MMAISHRTHQSFRAFLNLCFSNSNALPHWLELSNLIGGDCSFPAASNDLGAMMAYITRKGGRPSHCGALEELWDAYLDQTTEQ